MSGANMHGMVLYILWGFKLFLLLTFFYVFSVKSSSTSLYLEMELDPFGSVGLNVRTKHEVGDFSFHYKGSYSFMFYFTFHGGSFHLYLSVVLCYSFMFYLKFFFFLQNT